MTMPSAAAGALVLLLSLVAAAATAASAGGFHCRLGARPVLFNFGDSNSDTGGMAAAMGWHLTRPEGRAFFPRPTGRFCDGRLTVDFLCESVQSAIHFTTSHRFSSFVSSLLHLHCTFPTNDHAPLGVEYSLTPSAAVTY
jgi:hypothetical protein